MKSNIILNSIKVSAIALLTLTSIVSVWSHETILAKADKSKETRYMAGLLNGPICNCPVIVGNCVCAITAPPNN